MESDDTMLKTAGIGEPGSSGASEGKKRDWEARKTPSSNGSDDGLERREKKGKGREAEWEYTFEYDVPGKMFRGTRTQDGEEDPQKYYVSRSEAVRFLETNKNAEFKDVPVDRFIEEPSTNGEAVFIAADSLEQKLSIQGQYVMSEPNDREFWEVGATISNTDLISLARPVISRDPGTLGFEGVGVSEAIDDESYSVRLEKDVLYKVEGGKDVCDLIEALIESEMENAEKVTSLEVLRNDAEGDKIFAHGPSGRIAHSEITTNHFLFEGLQVRKTFDNAEEYEPSLEASDIDVEEVSSHGASIPGSGRVVQGVSLQPRLLAPVMPTDSGPLYFPELAARTVGNVFPDVGYQGADGQLESQIGTTGTERGWTPGPSGTAPTPPGEQAGGAQLEPQIGTAGRERGWTPGPSGTASTPPGEQAGEESRVSGMLPVATERSDNQGGDAQSLSAVEASDARPGVPALAPITQNVRDQSSPRSIDPSVISGPGGRPRDPRGRFARQPKQPGRGRGA